MDDGCAEYVEGSYEWVQAKLVEALQLWWRSPGKIGPGKTSPFASDIPAELIVKDVNMGDYDARGYLGTSSDVPLRPLSLDRKQVSERDDVSEWLGYVPEADRRLVMLALTQLASGRYKRIRWTKLRAKMGIKPGADSLRKRYAKSISGICTALDRCKREGRDGQGVE